MSIRKVAREIHIGPMDHEEAGRRLNYATKGSDFHRALLGVLHEQQMRAPAIKAAQEAVNAAAGAILAARAQARKWFWVGISATFVSAVLLAALAYMIWL